MLFNLLPGLREIRAPVISGYLWLAFFYLAFHNDLPSSKQPGAVLSPLFKIGEDLSLVGLATITGIAAYLVGSAMQELWKLVGRLLSSSRPLYGEAGIRTSPTGSEDVRGAVRAKAQEVSEQLAQVAVTPGEKGIGSVPDPEEVEKELPLIRTLLLGERPELVGELDRLQAEADLRITVAFPLALFALFLAYRASPGWLVLLLPSLLLLWQGYQRQLDAGDLLAKAMKIGKANAPSLEALSNSVEAVLNRVELEAELDKRTGEGDGLAAFRLGNMQASWDDFEAASISLNRAVENGVIRAYAELGLVYERRQSDEQAERTYRDGAQRGDEKCRQLLAELLRRLQRGEEARRAEDETSARHKEPVVSKGSRERSQASDYRSRMEAGDSKAAINLGLLLLRQGEGAAAVKALRRAVELDAEDPQAWSGLGDAQYDQARLTDARDSYRKALALHERHLGPSHLEAARDLENLALLSYLLGDYEASREDLARVLEIRMDQLSEDSPEVAETRMDLAITVMEFDESDLARDLAQKSLPTLEGAEPHARGMAVSQWGWINRELGYYSQARILEEQALGNFLDLSYGAENAIGVTRYFLGVTLADLGELEGAERELESAVEIFRRATGGAAQPRLAESLRERARIRLMAARYEAALVDCEEAVEIETRRLNPNHLQVGLTQTMLGAVARSVDDLEQAERHYRIALGVLERNPKRSAEALCLRGLGETLLQDSRSLEALEATRKAISLQLRWLRDGHPELGKSYEFLAEVHSGRNEAAAAKRARVAAAATVKDP